MKGALTLTLVLAVAAPAVARDEKPPVTKDDEKPKYKEYPRRPGLLSESEVDKLKGDVLSRCQLSPSTEPPTAPWYFHYELGLELTKRGDDQRALDAFIEAASRKGQPQHAARLYGLWFTDYLPYYRIARAHTRLGNWECTRDALRMSEQTREISAEDREFAELRELAREVNAKLRP